MALRARTSSSSTLLSSRLVGLTVFWNDPTANPTMDWDKWLHLCQVAMMAKSSISVTELTKEADEQKPRVRPLMRDLGGEPANKKYISVMYMAVGGAARIQFMEKYPDTALWKLEAKQLRTLCNECFRKKRNRTLDHY